MDKVRELAKLLVGGLNPNGYDSSWAEAVDVFERILRAELKSLLDAAEAMLNKGSYPAALYEYVAAELEGWKK